MSDHFDIVCEKCGIKIGGCRCPSKEKTIRKEGFCEHCSRTVPLRIGQEPWEAACKKIGLNFGYECSVRNWWNPNHCGECGFKFPLGFNPHEQSHIVPAPVLGDPEAVVAMLEYILNPLKHRSHNAWQKVWDDSCSTAKSVLLALAAAVNEVQL